MSTGRRIGYGVLAYIPLAGVVAVAFFDLLFTGGRSSDALMQGRLDEALPYLVAEVGLAFVQMGVAIPFVLHASKNPRLRTAGKIAWPLLCVFIGSFANPIYFHLHVWDSPAPGR